MMTVRLMALLTCLSAVSASAAPPVGTSGKPADLPAVTSATLVEVAVEPLTPAAFKPFGEAIVVPEGQPPTADTGAARYWGGLAKDRFAEEVEFGMLSVAARPREVAELQRSVRSPTFLAGLSGEWVLVVAPPTLAGRPLLASRVRAFVVKPGQAVLLHRGTWHADPFPRGESGLFLVAVRDGTVKKDLKSRSFKGKEAVRIP
ncbi:MAG: ureidoglycolate lyase [Candidatus Coatesbacteria bacterium]